MLYGEYLSLLNEGCQMDDDDEGDVPILAFEEVNMFAVGVTFHVIFPNWPHCVE